MYLLWLFFNLTVDELWITNGQAEDDLWRRFKELKPRAGLSKNCLQTQYLGLFLSNGAYIWIPASVWKEVGIMNLILLATAVLGLAKELGLVKLLKYLQVKISEYLNKRKKH